MHIRVAVIAWKVSCFVPDAWTKSCLWHHCGRAMFATPMRNKHWSRRREVYLPPRSVLKHQALVPQRSALCAQPTEWCRLRLVSKRPLWILVPVSKKPSLLELLSTSAAKIRRRQSFAACRALWSFGATNGHDRKTWRKYKWTIKVEDCSLNIMASEVHSKFFLFRLSKLYAWFWNPSEFYVDPRILRWSRIRNRMTGKWNKKKWRKL